jgi:hypothetical protein
MRLQLRRILQAPLKAQRSPVARENGRERRAKTSVLQVAPQKQERRQRDAKNNSVKVLRNLKGGRRIRIRPSRAEVYPWRISGSTDISDPPSPLVENSTQGRATTVNRLQAIEGPAIECCRSPGSRRCGSNG